MASPYHPSIARRMSRETDEPYLVDSYTRSFDGEPSYSRADCLSLAKKIGVSDMDKIPANCQEIVKQDIAMRKAWEGASAKDRAQHAIASRSGKMGHHQLQRRLTTPLSEAQMR